MAKRPTEAAVHFEASMVFSVAIKCQELHAVMWWVWPMTCLKGWPAGNGYVRHKDKYTTHIRANHITSVPDLLMAENKLWKGIECHWEFNKSKREGARMMQRKTQNNPAHNAWVSEFLFKVPHVQGTALKFAWSTKGTRAKPCLKSAHTLSSM